jgi:4-amino-4-deoxy-L-arabinose transferase-like glycosyltransferase
VAERPISFFFAKLSFEPPLYYLLLHFWMKIFGQSEIATRSLSFLGFVLATIIMIFWCEKIFKKSYLSWFIPIWFFINPMLIYYGFEVRTYGWYIFFATLSMWAYIEKKWIWLTIATIGGFYTHTYFIFTFATQFIHYLLFNYQQIFSKFNLKKLYRDKIIFSMIISLLCILPWMIKVIHEAAKLKNSWYFPVNLNLIKSVLGNLFLGYEGTPWYMWNITGILSIVLLFFFYIALRNKNTRKLGTYFFLTIIIPLTIVIGVSFIKPLYVNRYLISVTISEIILVGLGLYSIKNKYLNISITLIILSATVWFNMWYPAQHAKFPYRTAMQEINSIRQKNDVIFATSSLNFLETLYYAKDKNNIYFYSPNGSPFPWYVGDTIFSNSQLATKIPPYPIRAILVNPDGTYNISYHLEIEKYQPSSKLSP